VTRAYEEDIMGTYYLVDLKFLFGMIKKSSRMDGGNGCTAM
jgi:hypothetical protein